jgi:hypothetical protein
MTNVAIKTISKAKFVIISTTKENSEPDALKSILCVTKVCKDSRHKQAISTTSTRNEHHDNFKRKVLEEDNSLKSII